MDEVELFGCFTGVVFMFSSSAGERDRDKGSGMLEY